MMEAEDDSSESNGVEYDRPEASESGIITEMEHNRSARWANVDLTGIVDDTAVPAPASHNNQHTSKSSKGKSRRLSTRVARGTKKLINTAISSTSTSSSSAAAAPFKRAATDSKIVHRPLRPRSHSPPRTRSGDRPRSPQSSGEEETEPAKKNKHKSSYKHVAKAAAAAAKKLKVKKSSKKSSSHAGEKEISTVEHNTAVHHTYSSSANSSRASTPTHQLMQQHHPAQQAALQAAAQAQQGGNMTMVGKTPVNTPVHTTTIIDGQMIPQHVMQQLPATLAECDEDESESPGYNNNPSESGGADNTEASMEFAVFSSTRSTEEGGAPMTSSAPELETAAPVATKPSPTAATTPSEDLALKLAQAMALAVQANPNKSHQEIQRMVLGQPEFAHLAPTLLPSNAGGSSGSGSGSGSHSSSSGSKGFTKNFKSLQKAVASGAKTAQKGFMEYAGSIESALGSSTSNFSFGMSSGSGSSSSKATTHAAPHATREMGPAMMPPAATHAGPTPAAVPSVPSSSSLAHTVSSATTISAASSAPPPTIQEESTLSMSMMEQSHSTGVSLQGSNASMPTAAPPADGTAFQSIDTLPSVASYDNMTSNNNKADLPIKMTDVIWKRRSGFGSYYRSSAWERRRFVLQGNALAYFRASGSGSRDDDREGGHGGGGGGGEMMDDATERFENDPKYNAGGGGSGSKSTSTKQRMMDALEQTATSLGLSTSTSAATEKPAGEGPSSARGYMDLVKENAVVCATLGHSGAPSPFCLSIKVGGETKWKLCFASHRAQLMWLAAITDVIVQNSVDTYNVKLLSAADPANHDPTAAFQPSVYEPPAPSNETDGQIPTQDQIQQGGALEDSDSMPTPNFHHVSGRRLWMMEPYVIRAQSDLPPEGDSGKLNDDMDDDEDFDSEDEEDDSDDEEEDDNTEDKVPDTDATVDDSDIWFMPEKRLVIAAALINAAILYARNSSMSVQSFWMVVTVANMTLFTFLESMPRPGAVTASATLALQQQPAAVKPRKEKTKRKRNRKKGTGSGGEGRGADKDDAGDAAKTESGVKAKKKKEKFVPMAGMSAVRLKEHLDPKVNAKGEQFAAWMQIPGENLAVRSHGYMTTKAKVPSPGSLYELVQMDIFESPSRYPDMAPRVRLPKLSYDVDPEEVKTWRAPDHFVVSLSLPTDPPKLGASTSDGGGYTVTMYFNMNKTTRDILKRITADDYDPASEPAPEDVQKSQVNAIRLFEDWVRRAPNDIEFQKRFKMIPNVVNAKEVGLPSWIGKYNGKPFLIKRPGQTGFLLPHPEISCVEFDISLHVFPYLAKQGICYMKDAMFKKILASVGFVIEGRSDDELPECVIGLGQVCYPDPEISMQGADFFAGTARRSFEEGEDKKEEPAVDPPADESAALIPPAPESPAAITQAATADGVSAEQSA